MDITPRAESLRMARTLSSPQVLKTGASAPDFKLKGVDGKTHSLSEYKGKATLIVFICNHCPFVKARIGDITALQSKFKPSELQVIGINSNDPSYQDEGFDNMVKFSKEYNVNFPYLIDDSQDVARSYGAACTPDPFLFIDGKLAFHGRINDAMEPEARPTVPVMENNVRALMSGKKIEKDFDPSIGCSIKWKS
ncbi:thioredoxin family protein [Candidatus Nitrososphaera sp. FF02]|uniref:thioredoxin family protein n=1 Tax=Candidatus Nitrososphaera sp. FF02 TaxID=3398226 RepID=UPI0039EC984A